MTRATGAENTLSGRISVTEAQVGLVVEKKDGENVVNRASIVAAINEDDTSTATIKADKINLDGTVTSSTLYGTLAYLEKVFAGTETVSAINATSIISDSYRLDIRNSEYYLSNAVRSVSVTGPDANNQYKVQYLRFSDADNDPQTAGTFSRAITGWTAVAGNGVVTMTANPQNQKLIHSVSATSGNNFSSSVYNTSVSEDALISRVNMTMVANTSANTVDVKRTSDNTVIASLPVTFGGSISFGDWTWKTYAGDIPSQREVSISATDGSGGTAISSPPLTMMISQANWGVGTGDNNKKLVKLFAPHDNSTVRAQITVDATTRYNAGKTDGVASVGVAGSWSGRTYTATTDTTTTQVVTTRSTTIWGAVIKSGSKVVKPTSGTYKNHLTLDVDTYLSGTTQGQEQPVSAITGATRTLDMGAVTVEGAGEIANAGGSKTVTVKVNGVTIGSGKVTASAGTDQSGNVTLSSMAAGSGNVTYTQDTRGSYVSLPVDYTLSNGTTGTKPVNTVKFPFGVTLTPSKSGSSLVVSATVPGTSGTLTVNSGSYAVNNLYTLTEKTAAQLNDASTGSRLDGAVGTVINGNLTYNRAYTGMGWVWAHPAAVSGHTDQMTLTSYLSNATSTSATHFAKKATTIALSADKATLNPGEAATISAKVGNGTYASVAVSARAINLRTGVEVTPSTEAQIIKYDGYDGLGTVTVKAAAATGGGTLTAWKWTDSGSSAEENTVSTSIEGTTTTKAIKLVLTQSSSWNADSTKKVYLRDTSSYGNLHASITVDASTVYTAGRNSSRITYQHSATAADGTWVTFTPSNPYTISGEFVAVLHDGSAQFFYGGGGDTPTPTGHSISVTADGTDISKQSNGTYVDKSGNTVTVNADFALGAGHNKRFKITCGTATYYIRVTPT